MTTSPCRPQPLSSNTPSLRPCYHGNTPVTHKVHACVTRFGFCFQRDAATVTPVTPVTRVLEVCVYREKTHINTLPICVRVKTVLPVLPCVT
jgi:hypothetical protein